MRVATVIRPSVWVFPAGQYVLVAVTTGIAPTRINRAAVAVLANGAIWKRVTAVPMNNRSASTEPAEMVVSASNVTVTVIATRPAKANA